MLGNRPHCRYLGPGPDSCPDAMWLGKTVLPCADCPLRRWQVEFTENRKPLYRWRDDKQAI